MAYTRLNLADGVVFNASHVSHIEDGIEDCETQLNEANQSLKEKADQADVEQNTADIATNAENIAANTADIATNAENIAANTADIATNADAISEINQSLTNLDMFEELYSDDVTTTGGSFTSIRISFTSRSGYTPVLVNAVSCPASENSSNYGYIAISLNTLSSSTLIINGRNFGASTIESTYRIRVLIMFVKN